MLILYLRHKLKELLLEDQGDCGFTLSYSLSFFINQWKIWWSVALAKNFISVFDVYKG